MADTRENMINILRKTRYEYRRYIGMKDMEKRMAKTEEEFCAIDDSILGEITFCADFLIAHGVTVQEWISVKDRLPDNKEHDWVLAQVVEDNGFMHIPKVMEYRHQRNDWFEETYGWLSEHNGAFTVTHWMPLPLSPEVKND